MSTTTRRWLRGTVAAFAAALLAVGGATASHAAPIIPDPGATGTLHIFKHQTPGGAPGNGLQATPATPPVAGVVFTAVKLNSTYDLSTNAGWTALAALNGNTTAAAGALSAVPADTHVTAATSATGETTLASLPIGAYLVTETSTPPGVTAAAPFLVTVPMTDPNNLNNWLYDVYVYPKNAVTPPPVKTVADATATGFGTPVVYTISSEIPDLNTGQTIDFYAVRDTLPAQLTLGTASAALSSGTPALVAGTDYVITPSTLPAAGADLIVKFTAAGRAKLDANATQQVVITVNTTVNGVTPTGSILNTPVLYPNLSSWGTDPNSTTPDPGNPGVPGTPVDTRWGSIQLTKTSAAGGAPLAGAQFQVYATEADALAQTSPISTGNPAATTFITDANGVLTITGLRYSDWENGATDPTPRTYYLVETVAPTGYELLANPIPVIVNDPVELQNVQNSPKNGGFQLPFTGATGQWLFPVGGALLLAGAALILIARNRRHSKI